MRIAIVGYGKMGRMVEDTALRRGHEVVCRIDKDNISELDSLQHADVDAAIEFSTPLTAYGNVKTLLQKGIPVVCGTTGWDVEMLKQEYAHTHPDNNGTPWIWASNFSVGVNLLFAVNCYLAQLMHAWGQYKPSVEETHHIHKLDKPSGTAKTLAEDIQSCGYTGVPVESVREGEVPGIHTVSWDSTDDCLSLTHTAKSRTGFALGAVIAAEWLQGRTGLHTMQEVLDISQKTDNSTNR